MKARFGASTLAAVLSLMGVTALGAAGYNAVTGDLCAMVGSCSTGCDSEKSGCATSCDEKSKVVEASAKEGEGKACCALGSLAKEASAKGDCASKCSDGAAKTVNASAKSDCSSKSECSTKSCDGGAKTIAAGAKSDSCCKSGSKTIAAGAKSDSCCKSGSKTIAAGAKSDSCCKSGSKTIAAGANGDCANSCGSGAKTIAVAGSEGGTCASTCSGENVACTWKQTAEEIDANLIAAKAAYEGACGGKCKTTKGMAKAKLMAAEWRSAERDLHRAHSKLAQLKVAKAQMAYDKACGGKCETTKGTMKAAVLQAKVQAEETYVKYSNFMECRKCIEGHNGKLKEAKVMQASYEYDAACEKGCESSKAAAKAKIEAIKAGKDCATSCTGEKSAAACATSCKGEQIASKNGADDKAAMMAVSTTSPEGATCANTCSSSKSCSKDKSAL